MSRIVTSIIAKTITNTNKFIDLTVVENGLILEYQNKQKIEISYNKLDKVYVKKYKLNPFVELLCIIFPFLFVYIALQYLPFYLTIFVGVLSVSVVFMYVLNYKWYELFVLLKDGTYYKKKVSQRTKAKIFSIICRVEKDFFDYKSNLLTSA